MPAGQAKGTTDRSYIRAFCPFIARRSGVFERHPLRSCLQTGRRHDMHSRDSFGKADRFCMLPGKRCETAPCGTLSGLRSRSRVRGSEDRCFPVSGPAGIATRSCFGAAEHASLQTENRRRVPSQSCEPSKQCTRQKFAPAAETPPERMERTAKDLMYFGCPDVCSRAFHRRPKMHLAVRHRGYVWNEVQCARLRTGPDSKEKKEETWQHPRRRTPMHASGTSWET